MTSKYAELPQGIDTSVLLNDKVTPSSATASFPLSEESQFSFTYSPSFSLNKFSNSLESLYSHHKLFFWMDFLYSISSFHCSMSRSFCGEGPFFLKKSMTSFPAFKCSSISSNEPLL